MINKLKIKEQSFQITANIDERLKARKYKLIVKSPNTIVIRPKPNGIIINQLKNTDVYKQDQGIAIIVKKSEQTAVYKQFT